MEILFRGFHKQADGPDVAIIDGIAEKGMWVYGIPAIFSNIKKERYQAIIPFKKKKHVLSELVDVCPSTIGQYTGLTDKNGKKIFLGDILSTDLSRPYNIVVYKNGAFMEECEDGGKLYYDIFFPCEQEQEGTYPYSEVIGTIYDSPPEGA